MNKQELKRLFELEQSLGISEPDRFHNTEKGKRVYAELFGKEEDGLTDIQKQALVKISAKYKEPSFDWETFRNETAAKLLAALLSNSGNKDTYSVKVNDAINLSHMLIEELKKPKQ